MVNRLGCRVAQGQQDSFGALGTGLLQFQRGSTKGLDAKVILPFRAIDAIKKGGQIDELGAGFHEIQVYNLLACHNFNPGAIFSHFVECNKFKKAFREAADMGPIGLEALAGVSRGKICGPPAFGADLFI
jgi:hypothetical protein